MTDGARWDALLVAHRLTDPDRLGRICRQNGCRRVALLTTHRPFAHEREDLVHRLHPAAVEFFTFAELLDDAAATAIDDGTTRDLLARHEPPDAYVHVFQTEMTHRKNAAVHQRLRQFGTAARLFADSGLGIAWRYWQGQGASPLAARKLAERIKDHPARVGLFYWWHARRMPAQGTWLEAGGGSHLFAGKVHRLPLRAGVATTAVPFNRRRAAKAGFVATTVHDHWPVVHTLGRPVRIFADGFLPSNYPRSYLDGYGPAEFVATDPFSADWLRQHGRTVAPVPPFLAPAAWAIPANAPATRTVVGLLNHTGDWSALVNRSDTDVLAEAFVGLAAAHPRLTFLLRPHPGMDARQHEGCGGVARLAALVDRARLPNLTCSTGPLARDLAQGDLFVSEYSATLIEAWRGGKPGVIANLTGRRSFMEDFARLGFAQVTAVAALVDLVGRIHAGDEAFWSGHRAAIARYNQRLAEFLAR